MLKTVQKPERYGQNCIKMVVIQIEYFLEKPQNPGKNKDILGLLLFNKVHEYFRLQKLVHSHFFRTLGT